MNLVSSSLFAERPWSDAHPPSDGVLLITPPITRGRLPTLVERWWWSSVSRAGLPPSDDAGRLPGSRGATQLV